MGTRHLVMVISKGKTKVAQYGQFDGYLDETGVGVLEFLIKNNDENFIQKIDNCEFISSKEVDKKNIELNPQFYRNTSYKVLKMIAESENGIQLFNMENFIIDSLFCEWAYIIDYDKKTFEIYKGFNRKKLSKTERFAFYQEEESFKKYIGDEKREKERIYYPCKLLAKFKLNKLPSVEKFKDICENSVTEQEEYLKKKFNENIKEFEKSLKGK